MSRASRLGNCALFDCNFVIDEDACWLSSRGFLDIEISPESMFCGPALQSPKGTISPWIRPVPLSAYWALFERRKITIVEKRFLESSNKSLPHEQSRREKKASVGLTLNENPHIRPKIHLCLVSQHLAQPEYEWMKSVRQCSIYIDLFRQLNRDDSVRDKSVFCFELYCGLRQGYCVCCLRDTTRCYFALFSIWLIKTNQPWKRNISIQSSVP